MKCSVGVLAYNEEKNIGRLLEALLNQELNQAEIDEIFVVASGCTDRTIPVAKEFARKDSRVKVLIQEKREGKFSAINLFLKSAKNEILVMASGDTLPGRDAVENLVRPLEDRQVGMAGARPTPLDDPETFLGFTSLLLWGLHHQISLKEPKMGEMVAFRKCFKKIPPVAVDEAYIEGLIKEKGYKIVYAPKAVVYNEGAKTIQDFLKQRRRIHCGHLHLKEMNSYQVSTMNSLTILSLVLKSLRLDFQNICFTFGAIFLEATARLLGWWDYRITKRNHVIWERIKIKDVKC